MHNLKYIIAGVMLGGAIGAKAGEYFSTLMVPEKAFEWIESAMLLGSLSGLLVTLGILAAVAYNSAIKQGYQEYEPGKEPTMSRA